MRQIVPNLIIERWLEGEMQGEMRGGVLCVDVVGFTRLTARLTAEGREGAEVMGGLLNQVFGPTIKTIYGYGGEVVSFAGDALTAVFPGPQTTVGAAMQAAAEVIKAHFADETRFETRLGSFPLSSKIGLAYGGIEWGIVGLRQRKSFFFRGEAVRAAATLAGEVGQNEIGWAGEMMLVGGAVASAVAQAELTEDVERLFFASEMGQTPVQGEFREVNSLFVAFPDDVGREQCEQMVTDMMTVVAQFGGYFNKVEFGDKGGVMLALFGAPVAHENDTERALRCVYALQERWKEVDIGWRAGLSLGTAYAGWLGSEERQEYTALGDSVNLAARLMMSAEEGEVRVATAVTAHPLFAFEWLGAQRYRGWDEAVTTYRLVGMRSVEERVFAQPLAGRSEELATIVASLERLREGRFAGVTLLYGEAGMGKSRLAYEVKQKLPWGTQLWTGQTDEMLRQPFNPFIHFLKSYFGQALSATVGENEAEFERRWAVLLGFLAGAEGAEGVVTELRRLQSVLLALVGLPVGRESLYATLDAQGRYQNSIQAIKNLILAETYRQPVLFVLEDAHWLDDASREMLVALTRQVDHYPWALLVTSRYGDDGELVAYEWAEGTAVTTIDLQQLTVKDLRYLAEGMLAGPITDQLAEMLFRKTEANPFFVQQVLYYVQEQGMLRLNERGAWELPEADFALPGHIKAILTARIDRLPPDVKDVVKIASVLGREFELKVLSYMLRAELATHIATAEKEQIWAAVSTVRYIFKHALLRDAAYDMQLRERLRQLHRRAAEAYETLYAEDKSLAYADLAYHYQLADEAVLGRKYARLAGEQAVARYAQKEGVRFFSQALGLWPAEAERERYELLLAREGVYHRLGEREKQIVDLEALLVLGEALGGEAEVEARLRRAAYEEVTGGYEAGLAMLAEAEMKARDGGWTLLAAKALWRQGSVYLTQGNNEKATELFEQVLAEAEAVEAYDLLADSWWGLGVMAKEAGDYEKALAHYRASLAQHERTGRQERISACWNSMGVVMDDLGRYEEARAHLEQALRIRQEIGDKKGESVSLNNLGVVMWNQNDMAGSRDYFERSLALVREIGDQRVAGICLGNLGEIAHHQGDLDGARSYYEQALVIDEAIGYRWGEGMRRANLSLLAVHEGDVEEALRWAEEGVVIAEEVGSHYLQGYTLLRRGHALLAAGRAGEAGMVYEQVAGMRAEKGQGGLVEAWAGLAAVAADEGDWEKAVEWVERIMPQLDKGLAGSVFDPVSVALVCYDVWREVGELERAEGVLRMSYTDLQERGEAIADPVLRRMFWEGLPSHRRVMKEGGSRFELGVDAH
ncbi:MAG TPA: tetratricopeptide repeat protein [Anaerolineae bacterium]|nr:tetratricopeptide repeat protein [Anaerolineae bacterium]